MGWGLGWREAVAASRRRASSGARRAGRRPRREGAHRLMTSRLSMTAWKRYREVMIWLNTCGRGRGSVCGCRGWGGVVSVHGLCVRVCVSCGRRFGAAAVKAASGDALAWEDILPRHKATSWWRTGLARAAPGATCGRRSQTAACVRVGAEVRLERRDRTVDALACTQAPPRPQPTPLSGRATRSGRTQPQGWTTPPGLNRQQGARPGADSPPPT